MRLLGLCGSLRKAYQLDVALKDVADVERRFVIANPEDTPTARFLARVALGGGRLGPRGWLWAINAFLHGRLVVSGRDLDDPALLAKIRSFGPDIGLHGIGVIYRRPLLDCFRLGILNAHIGLLPRYRGRCVMEWALLNGDQTGISTFLIDEGIDTGPVVVNRVVDVFGKAGVQEAKRSLFALDGEMFAEALRVLRAEGFQPTPQRIGDGTRWYVMSRLLTSVVDEIVSRGTAVSAPVHAHGADV